jgi:hypothetical protein
MKIIPEEDEYPESPPADKIVANIQQLGNLPKLNKIVESEDEGEKSSTPNATIFTDNSTTTSGILRSKELRSVIESKRRNLSRSCSSSDSEDSGSNHEMNRLTNRKTTRSPNSLQESESLINHRGRSYSNIEHVLNENSAHNHQQMISSNYSETTKRRSFSRASSIVSANRLTLTNINDEMNTDTPRTNSLTLINDRARSLSNDHRLANHSQMSIASRISIRYSTPRESTVFTKTEAPPVVRFLQQTPHQDTTEVIKTLIEHQRLQSHQEPVQTAIIVEEEISPPFISISNTNIKSSIGKNMSNGVMKSNVIVPTMENVSLGNGRLSSNSVLSTLKYSLIKRQKQRKSSPENSSNRKSSTKKHRACCTIL